MNNIRNILHSRERKTILIIFIACLALISYNLVSAYYYRPFTSDDVFWQVILRSWHPFTGGTVTLGNSSIYVDKIPLYELINHFFKAGRKELFAEAAIETWIGFTAFYFASVYFLKKCKAKINYITLMPYVWFSSFGYSFISLYLNPNWRGFQIGISFGYFALIAALLERDIKLKSVLTRILFILSIIFAGLQTYSDPYFLYFTFLPVVLLLVVLVVIKNIQKRKLITLLIGIIGTLLSAKVFGLISSHAGIRTSLSLPMQTVDFENIPKSFWGALEGVLNIFNANFFGEKVISLLAVLALLNFILLVYIVWSTGSSLRKIKNIVIKKITFDQVWINFFAFLSLLLFLTFTISTLAQGAATYRYFLMLVLTSLLILAIKLGRTKSVNIKNFITTILLGATLLSLINTQFGSKANINQTVDNNKANGENYQIIKIVEQNGYTKGYANYWQANIDTYLSGGKIDFLSTICDHKTDKFRWLINDNAFTRPAAKTFYISDPDIKDAPTCNINELEYQFGQPSQTIQIDDKTLLLYNYDISNNMDYYDN